MTGHEYEHLVAKYLKNHGYSGVKVTQASGDFGVDVIAHKDGKKYAVQCKMYNGAVGVGAVQEVVAGQAHYGCDRAMVITNSTYTKAAYALADDNGVILLEGINSTGIGSKTGLLKWGLLAGYIFVVSAGVCAIFEHSIFGGIISSVIAALPIVAYALYRVRKIRRKNIVKTPTQTPHTQTKSTSEIQDEPFGEINADLIRTHIDCDIAEEDLSKIIGSRRITTPLLQRTCQISYAQAARIVDSLFRAALITPTTNSPSVYEWTGNAKKPS